MDKFSEEKVIRKSYLVFGMIKLRWIRILMSVLLTACVFIRPGIPMAQDRPSVAVLPFEIHATKSLDHLKLGLQEMLAGRLEERGMNIISLEMVNNHPSAFMAQIVKKDLIEIGTDLGAKWVIAGIATQIGEKISIDLKLADVVREKEPAFIFEVAEDTDSLTDTIKRLAARADHNISGVVLVDSVKVRGNQRIDTEAILAVVKTTEGDGFDYEQLDKDLRDIYKMGYFKDVKIESEDGPKGKAVTFIITEKPSIGKIVFKGNKVVKEDDLKEELGIKLYSIQDHNEIKQSINRLTDFYRQKGYYNVEIKEQEEPLPNNEVCLVYEIAEHEKVYIKKIQFLGNDKFDEDDLKDIMETNEKGFFSWITDSGVLDRKKLEFDVHVITSYYHNHGYINAKVGAPKISFEKDTGLTITIEIEEGNQYGVSQVAIEAEEGDLIKPMEELMEKVQIGKEKVFNREVVRKDILALKNVYVDEGFAYAEVTPRTAINQQEHMVDIIYKVSKGKKVRFERINIIGNTVTRDKVIRRELKVIEGEFYSGKALRRSNQNLERLGFFEDIEVQTKKGSQDDLMVLDFKITERPTGSFSVGAGYSSEDSVFAIFQVAQNNLFGRGQQLQASAKLGGSSTEYDIKFIEPWLYDTEVSATFDVYKWSQEYDDYEYEGEEYEDYSRDSMGGRIGFGVPLGIDEDSRISAKYGYDDTDISDVPDDASVEWKDMEGRNVTSSITFSISRDSRDKPWNTTKGSVNSLSFEYAGGILGGDVYFNKYRLKSAWYFPLFWDTVFLVQGNWGYVKRRSGGKLPVYQKFRIGGINSVRGFDYASISPLDPETKDRIGGEKMMYYNFEYRFPLFMEQGIVGLVFFDAGNVFEEDESFSFSGIRRSAGPGIRWYSPMGPLRLEYGHNLDKEEGEESGKWEFSVGGLF